MTQSSHTKLRNQLRVQGYCDGAGKRALSFEFTRFLDYRQGYADGYVAREAYAKKVTKELGITGPNQPRDHAAP